MGRSICEMSKQNVIAALSVTVLTVFIALYYHVTLREATLLPTNERSNDTKSTTLPEKESFQVPPEVYQYKPPPLANVSKLGKPLRVPPALLESVGLPMTEFVNLSRKVLNELVFVIGASSNHFKESIDAIAGVQKFMPGYKIIYYDLGLTKQEIKQVKSFCNVEYREFNYSKYPPHVSNLYTYAFKPLIVQEVLSTHPGALWMDASVRLFKNFSSIYNQILKTNGFLQFWHSPHFNRAVIHPDQYLYFPTNEKRQQDVPTRGAAPVIFYRTKKVYWSLFHWWVMCALDKDCISPKGSTLSCNFRRYGIKRYAHCHRYDQAALNLLSSNLYGYNDKLYTATDQGVMKVMKLVTSFYKVKTCPVKT